MNKKQIILFSLISLILGGLYFFTFSRSTLNNNNETIEQNIGDQKSIPKTATIPNYFSQDLDLDAIYVYNVSQFGGDTAWYNRSQDWMNSYEGDWRTDPDGQIIINFTDFYDYDTATQWSDRFTDRKMAFMDMEIYERSESIANFTQLNTSNSEIANAMALNFDDFNSGFLLPTDNWSAIKENATLAATAGFLFADLTIDDTYNYLFLSFQQYDGWGGINQKTELKYDKHNGLLLWAYTEFGNYKLELFLTNYSVDLDNTYIYNVKDFGGIAAWYNFSWSFEGVWFTNIGGKFIIDYVGKYNKDPLDGWFAGDSYPSSIKRIWFDIDIQYNYFGSLDSVFSLNNISNREASTQMTMGYNGYQPGFFLPNPSDLSSIISNATTEASGTGKNNGTLTLKTYNSSIEISWVQTDGVFDQVIQLIYERDTGILLYAKISVGNYLLEIVLDDYEPPEEETPLSPTTTPGDDDDDDDNKKKQTTIPSFPLTILFILSAITISAIIFKLKYRIK